MVSVLGISPGTRTMGLVVFSDTHIVYSQVKKFQGVWSERKLNAIMRVVTKVLDRYCVSLVVCKVVHSSSKSAVLDTIEKSIEGLCLQKGVRFSSCFLDEVLEVTLPSGQKASKAILADMIALKHPEVALEFSKERINRHPYYIKLFEAIAVWEFHRRHK